MTTPPRITSHVVHWAAIECEKQLSGERSVAWMIDGWAYACRLSARRRALPITYADVLTLGKIVEPRKNQDGIRRVPVRVGWDLKMPAEHVPAALTQLIDGQRELDPDEWYRQYEEVHPFRDGNGRTGSIWWNLLRGTLAEPEAPPDFWAHTDVAERPPTSAQVASWVHGEGWAGGEGRGR